MEHELTAALLTLAWTISEGKQYWATETCRRFPKAGVANPNPNNPADWELWDKKKVILERWRQFARTVEAGGLEFSRPVVQAVTITQSTGLVENLEEVQEEGLPTPTEEEIPRKGKRKKFDED